MRNSRSGKDKSPGQTPQRNAESQQNKPSKQQPQGGFRPKAKPQPQPQGQPQFQQAKKVGSKPAVEVPITKMAKPPGSFSPSPSASPTPQQAPRQFKNAKPKFEQNRPQKRSQKQQPDLKGGPAFAAKSKQGKPFQVQRSGAAANTRPPHEKGKPEPAKATFQPPAKPIVPAPEADHSQEGASVTSIWSAKLEKLIREPSYQPLDIKGLAKKLGAGEALMPELLAFLAAEEIKGRVMQVRGSLYVLPKKLGISVGHLQMNERGFGFFVPIDPTEPDFYVAGQETGTAFHGDFCLARVKTSGRGKREERLRGEIVKVLRRKRMQLVGTLRKTPQFYFVVPDETRIARDIYVLEPKMEDALGSKVVVELKDWVDPNKPPEGVVTEVLGAPGDPGVDLLSIIRKYELPSSFPENVEQSAADISAAISPEEIARREDFRSLFTLTIDPDDAKDFDDALSFIKHPNGDLEVFIHIADVSHFVQPGSALDSEATSRGNSVYLVDRVIPMLPEKLSNGICSLQPEVDRLVKTAVVLLSSKGQVKQFRFAEGVIHSKKRFTYKEAFALLQKPAKTALGEHLHTLDQMAQILRKIRHHEGSLDLDFPEVKVRVNDLGIPTSLERVDNDASHQLIEEYMLLANDVVAVELKSRNRPGVYRVHESPDPAKLEEFRANVKAMGFQAGDLTHRSEVQKLIARVSGQPGESVVKIGLLRSLKRAMYTPKPLGHYGLAKPNYTHFTSPIRRYADLLVHRLLFRDKRLATPYTTDALSRLCAHISNTERTASEAEQESVKLKKLEYFDREARASQRSSFTALILEIRTNGLVVEIPEYVIQGRIKLSSLEGDLFDFSPQRQELKGQRTGALLAPGLTLTVEVESVDLAKRQVDFKVKKAVILKIAKDAGGG